MGTKPFRHDWYNMNKLLLIALCLLSFPAMAQEVNENGYIELPGNAYYRPGNTDNVYIYRRYGTDDVVRALVNPYATRGRARNFPSNDFNEICGNVERKSELRRCREDVLDVEKDRAKLYRKYN